EVVGAAPRLELPLPAHAVAPDAVSLPAPGGPLHRLRHVRLGGAGGRPAAGLLRRRPGQPPRCGDIEHRGPHRAPGAGGPGGSAGEHATPPERVARALASAARLRSVDPAARVPFNIYSRRHGLERTGGKEDPGTTSRSWQPGCCPSATAAPSRPSTPRGPCSSPPPACPAWPAPGPTSEAAGRPCASAWPGLPRARREAHRHHRRIHPNPSWDRVVWQLSSAHARAALSRSSSSSSSPPPLPFPLPHPSVVAGAFCFWLGPGFKQPMRVSTVFGNHAA
ncbi:unnamed protein product, partial [Prorocentrum cordatum]